MRVLAYAALACLLPQLAAAAHFGDGLAAYFLENYEKARAEWQPLAEAGDTESQFYLGLLYETGRGVERDPDTAVKWYLKAAEAGHGEAAYRLAGLARQSDAVAAEPDRLLTWVETAANAGIAEAQYEMGAFYAEGRVVERNYETALTWFAKAEESFADGPKRRQAAKMRELVAARLKP